MKIGIDFGGHTIVAARFEWSCKETFEIVHIAHRETPPGRGIDESLSVVADVIAELSGGTAPEGVGLALPSMLDANRRHARRMPNFPREWDDLDVVDALSRRMAARGFGAPLRIENDANCYALGEGVAGVARGVENYVVFTMGTGIGCGIVLGGRLLVGAHGMAGEAGHVVVSGDAPCGCGGMGHAETLAAVDGTMARARAEGGLPDDFRALWALRGTPAADRVLDVTIDAMARAVASVCHTVDPETVVLGGGMSQAPGIVEAIAEKTRPYLSRPFKNTLDLRRSELGNKAALYGAASL